MKGTSKTILIFLSLIMFLVFSGIACKENQSKSTEDSNPAIVQNSQDETRKTVVDTQTASNSKETDLKTTSDTKETGLKTTDGSTETDSKTTDDTKETDLKAAEDTNQELQQTNTEEVIVVPGGTYIVIDTSNKMLSYYMDDALVKEYPIADGAPKTPTPRGEFKILNKAVQPAWIKLDGSGVVPGGSPDNPLGPRWMGFHGGCGIHGTIWPWTIGTAASHGCVRMYNEDVIELYDMVQVGTKVIVK